MEFKVKNGYVLVKPVASNEYDLSGSFRVGSIAVGPEIDLGVIVFFSEYDLFTTEYMLVKVEDIAVWIKPEIAAPIEVIADEPKND